MIKNILVPIAGLESDKSALKTAFLVARLFNAHIECLHVRPTASQMAVSATAADLGAGMASAEIFDALRAQDESRTKNAHHAFKEFCQGEGVALATEPPTLHAVSAEWREPDGDELDRIVDQARYHDLVVLARETPDGARTLRNLGAILVDCGRPVILAPPHAPENLASTIAIAWKDTREAARAVTAAMPLLAKAQKIVVLNAFEENTKAGVCVESAERLVRHLRWHGLRVESRCVVPGGRELPAAIVETAQGVGADLLVMGGYGHSRTRELVFGGFTRHVLLECPLPVFLFH